MEFIVTRTSLWGDKSRPCWEAYPKTIHYRWMGEERAETVWAVKFIGLKDLIEFKNKYKRIIVGKTEFGFKDAEIISFDSLEIYDSYRE